MLTFRTGLWYASACSIAQRTNKSTEVMVIGGPKCFLWCGCTFASLILMQTVCCSLACRLRSTPTCCTHASHTGRVLRCRILLTQLGQTNWLRTSGKCTYIASDAEGISVLISLPPMRRWWAQIFKAQVLRGVAVYAEPEFGPAPYMHTMPHTNIPVADLWTVNEYMATRLKSLFASSCGCSSC
jgi:hypothetical protein